MFSVFLRLAFVTALLGAADAPASARELRICADPNNLPFSNERREGFENKIVDLIAREIGAEAQYTWWAQRRGFIRNTLNAKLCDVIPGITATSSILATTAPYYRSSYVFVTRQESAPINSFDDPMLRDVQIGVHLLGADGFNVPPAHALARRGIVDNVHGYSLYGDYRESNPPAKLIEAVADHEIDVALAWGPLAGYFVAQQKAPLRISLVKPKPESDDLPMSFDVAMGVRRHDLELRDELNAVLRRRASGIDAILSQFGVPRAQAPIDPVRP
jgi:mxaJ protein